MSKAKKKKNGLKKVDKPIREPNRRSILKSLGLLGGLTLIGGGALIHHFAAKEDKWGFLTAPVDIEKYFYEHQGNKNPTYYVPFGHEKYLKKDNIELVRAVQNATPNIIKINRSKGWNDKDVSVLVKSQMYGRVDDKRKYSEQYLEYIKTAMDFLYKKINNLERLDLDFKILNPGDDYSKDAKSKALIGVGNHTKQTIIVTHKVTKEQFEFPQYNVKEGSEVSLNFDSATGEFFYWIFFGRGKVAISSPFSELIPLATYKTFKSHSDKVGMERAIIISETVSEAISYLLSKEISDKLKITNGNQIIENNLELIAKADSYRYGGVPKAIEWMKQNGMQKGLDLYIENPEKFMSAVCS